MIIDEFRALTRPGQVLELEQAKAIGIGVRKHWVAHYYHYGDFYVGLCATRCGIDFTLVFSDGNDHGDMMKSIALKGLPPKVAQLTREEARAAQVEEWAEQRAKEPKETFKELMARTAAMGFHEMYAMAKDRGYHMEYFRSLPRHHQAFLRMSNPGIGIGRFEHYCAHYSRFDDFFHASCTTTDGADFSVTFRDGRAYDDMRKVGVSG